MNILNFGSLNIDHVYSLEHIVVPGETANACKFEMFSGGKGLNQSIAAARAGAQIFHAGCVGTEGEFLVDILSANRVNTLHINRVDERNGHAVIQVDSSGQNSIFINAGSNAMVSREYIDKVLEEFGSGDILLLQNEISNTDYLVEKAFEKHMFIILNPSPCNEKIKEIDFNKLSYVLLNEVEAKGIFGSEIPEECIRLIKDNYPDLKAVFTLGDKGCVCWNGERAIYQSAFETEAIDTTAAGDTFTGYFVAEIAKGTDCAKALKIASAAAALAVMSKGAEPSIPERSAALIAMGQLKEKNTARQSEILRIQIEEYMEKHIKTARLSELAEILGYSPVYTGSLIKKITGQSFSKEIQMRRCRRAAGLLLETELPVSEIIKDIGYENESFFRKVFKEYYGVKPVEYRKKGEM